MFTIAWYSLEFSPFSYRYEINGKYEIVSKFNYPPKTLIGKFKFPNQDIDLIELYSSSEPCKNYTTKSYDLKCKVFTSNSFLNLSGDKAFSREINEFENIPMQISFELNTDNLDYFLYLNRLNKNYDQSHINLIKQIKEKRINTEFKFKNTFDLVKYKNQKEIYELKVPFKWKNENGENSINYTDLVVKIDDYSDLKNKKIENWFSIKNPKKNIIIKQLNNSIEGKKNTLDQIRLKENWDSEWSKFSPELGFELDNELIKTSWTNNFLYSPYKFSGLMKSNLRFSIHNAVFSINIYSYFNFLGNELFNEDKKIKLKINSIPLYLPSTQRYKYKQIKLK